jgi:hypothetical protein
MWEHRRLTTLWAFTACYRDTFTFTFLPGAITPEVKRQRREADHSPPSSAEVKNYESIPPLSQYVFMSGA